MWQQMFFRTSGTVPSKRTPVMVSFNKRIIAVDEKGLTTGNLPTSWKFCSKVHPCV
jgi:hypothetical protein